MLSKCANPAGSATFHYFHEGRLFAIESGIDCQAMGPHSGPEYTGRSNSLQYFWLCSPCCRVMTIQSDGDRGVAVLRRRGLPPGVLVMDDRSLAASEVCMPSTKNPLQALKNELEFLQKGYYRTPLVWRLPLIFENSPICPKDRRSGCPAADCVLMGFVPKECRHEAVPCCHIPLNEIGETVDSLYRTGTNEEIEQTLQSWLLKTIRQLEESSGSSSWNERAA